MVGEEKELSHVMRREVDVGTTWTIPEFHIYIYILEQSSSACHMIQSFNGFKELQGHML